MLSHSRVFFYVENKCFQQKDYGRTLRAINSKYQPDVYPYLLGINVGGMPGTDSSEAFWWVSGGLFSSAIVLTLLLRRKKWL